MTQEHLDNSLDINVDFQIEVLSRNQVHTLIRSVESLYRKMNADENKYDEVGVIFGGIIKGMHYENCILRIRKKGKGVYMAIINSDQSFVSKVGINIRRRMANHQMPGTMGDKGPERTLDFESWRSLVETSLEQVRNGVVNNYKA